MNHAEIRVTTIKKFQLGQLVHRSQCQEKVRDLYCHTSRVQNDKFISLVPTVVK